MPKLACVLLVFLVSLHACSARHLSLTHRRNERKSRVLDKDVHSRKLGSSFILSHSEPTLVLQAQEHSTGTGADDLADTVVGKELETVVLKKDETTGREVVISYSGETTRRSTLESTPNEVEETANSEDNDTIDDVVAMDYAKPHRKPPIHNRKL